VTYASSTHSRPYVRHPLDPIILPISDYCRLIPGYSLLPYVFAFPFRACFPTHVFLQSQTFCMSGSLKSTRFYIREVDFLEMFSENNWAKRSQNIITKRTLGTTHSFDNNWAIPTTTIRLRFDYNSTAARLPLDRTTTALHWGLNK